jgi:hypothetical protein
MLNETPKDAATTSAPCATRTAFSSMILGFPSPIATPDRSS